MYQGKVHLTQGGAELVAESGGTVTVKSGGALNNEGTLTNSGTMNNTGTRQVNGAGIPESITFAIAAGGSNVSEVTVTVKDAAGNALAGVFNFDLWLSDASSGAGLTGTTASGAVAAKAASGADLGTLTSKKALRVQTLATGVYVLSITDSAKSGFYACAQVPGSGRVAVSAQLVTGSYG